MFKPFSLIFFILVMVWCGSILITSDPQKRMDRTCMPVEIAGVGAAAAMSLAGQSWADGTQAFFNKTHYACRYVIWSMFYEQDWNRAQAERAATQPRGATPAEPASAASRAGSAQQPRRIAP